MIIVNIDTHQQLQAFAVWTLMATVGPDLAEDLAARRHPTKVCSAKKSPLRAWRKKIPRVLPKILPSTSI